MWILSWTRYKASKFATFVSAVGAMVRYGGVLCLLSSLIPAGIICLIIGIALHFAGKAIAKSKVAKAAGYKAPKTYTAKPIETPPQANSGVSATAQAPSYQPQAQPQPQPQTQPQTQAPSPEMDATKPAGLRRPCPQCGSFVLPDAKFCNDCGAQLMQNSFCPQCGSPLGANDKFCGKCGYRAN